MRLAQVSAKAFHLNLLARAHSLGLGLLSPDCNRENERLSPLLLISDGRASYHDMTKKLSESTNAPAMKMVENPAVLAAARQPPTSEPSSVVDSIQRLEAIATTTSIHPLVS